jgi:hypothetical protein
MEKGKLNNKKTFYKAPFIAHWATGPIPCCEEHKNGILKLGSFMGTHVAITKNENEEIECINCINENKD